MTTSDLRVFHLAAFDATGELVGQTSFDPAQLSPKWLQFCDELLTANGERFAVNLPVPLNRIALRFTAASGAAMATFSASGHLANSILLLSGHEPDADNEVRQMFHQSISASISRLGLTRNPSPFRDLVNIAKRPLACVVAWGSSHVSDEDDSLVKELSWHLAAAFFESQSRQHKAPA
jgi:hypothetical protein